MAERRLRVLLVLKHAGYIGVYASLVRELARRGHAVHVAYVGSDREGIATLEQLSLDAAISHGTATQRGLVDGWASVAWLSRALGDLARYSHPRFADAAVLRDRMAAKVQSHLASAAGFDPLTRRLARRRARYLHDTLDAELAERAIRTSSRLERAIPTSRRVTAFVREHTPDVVLASPLIDLASPLVEHLKAARHLGIPTGICVASWDNLTSKGLVRIVPERVFVWNETQRREAVELHGIPASRVVATGAARFDDWFAQRPSTSREHFADKIGLDPARPFLLYLCSSGFVAPDEVGAVSRWIQALRTAPDDRMREVGVVIRPHPKRVEPWRSADFARLGNVTVWPRIGSGAGTGDARADFYDSIAHSAAVVGVNTSAMIEAAIVGKSVYTWIAPEFAQEGTIHFHYLLHENGGFLHVARSQQEHLEQLTRGLAREADEAARTRLFVESFVRPGGLERSATGIYADAVEQLADLDPAPPAHARSAFPLRLALAPIAVASTVALTTAIGKAAARNRLPGARGAERRKPRVGPALRILFSLLHPGYLRHYGKPIRILAERGHEVHVALGRLEKDPGDLTLIEELAADYPTVTYSLAPARTRRDGWRRLAWLIRASTDLARYGDPRYADAPALRARIAAKFHWRIDYSRLPTVFKPPLHRAVERHATGADAARSERTIARLRRLEEAIPANRRITQFIAGRRPDVVLASPVIEFASSQVEYLKSARKLGIRTGICVASWDNLTGKGLLRFVPDRVFVWNDIQRSELEEMHGIPPDRVVLTGAQRFDEWFGREPATTKEEFARKVGLDPARPYVLYLCSSPFIAPNEVDFVRRWAGSIRGSNSPALREAGLVVRPHPQNGRQWRGVDLTAFGNAVVWPPEGAQPDSGEARADFFDSLAHSACIVGINTSALIEAGIVGKSVLTVLDADFAGTQAGTLHFHYLRWENGGPLRVAADLAEHLAHLESALAHGVRDARQVTGFIERFCRPYGLDQAAAPRVAAGIEELGRLGPLPRALPDAGTIARRAVLYPVATTMSAGSNLLAGLRWTRKHVLGAARPGS